MRKVLALVLVIGLCVSLSAPVFATSSDEYRRGYMDGYLDGLAKGYELLGISAPDSTATAPAAEPKVKAEPTNGKILLGKEDEYGTEFTVKASAESPVVVLLKTKAGVKRIAFYVRAGKTVTVRVPSATFYAYFAHGDANNWRGYGEGKMFGDSTVYTKDDTVLDFRTYSYTYTLYPVKDGNFEQIPSSETDFF